MSATPDRVVHRGGCHCRRVRFEVDAPAEIEALDCNCSICRMTGFLHLIVPAARFPARHRPGPARARCPVVLVVFRLGQPALPASSVPLPAAGVARLVSAGLTRQAA